MPINPTTIKPQSINQFSLARRFTRGMGTGAMLPLIALEAFVTGGRTIQAYNRGGFDEARERFTEEAIGAAFWFCGVKVFNKMNDKIGQKVLKLVDTNFDVGKDTVRNPLANYLKDKGGKGLNEKTIGKFKLAKVTASVLLANLLVGLVVPKINQKITVALQKKRTTKENNSENTTKTNNKPKETQTKQEQTQEKEFFNYSIDKFQKDNTKNDVSFGMNAQGMLSIAHKFENSNIYQLLSTDVGIAGGRAVSSRNEHERNEVLFRDLTSIYFYMFNIPNIHTWLNLLEDGKKSRLDPVASKQVTDQLKLAMAEHKDGLDPDTFKKLALGDETNLGYMTKQLDGKFDSKGIIKLDDLIAQIKKNPQLNTTQINEYIDCAKRMSTLQPKVQGVSILTKAQVEDVFKGGALNMPEFLNNVYGLASNNEMFGKSTKYKHQDPYKFVGQGEFTAIKDDITEHIINIVKKAKKAGKKITLETIENADKMNFRKNLFNRSVGFAISAAFLSTYIPKIQYWITKKATGQDSFPGLTDYSDEKKNK